ncbi:MAG TPA: hypothetical protein DEA08_31675 [Planctomycetes bacterium]|nr:hypothetical protein [Planctomycetota bacterium]
MLQVLLRVLNVLKKAPIERKQLLWLALVVFLLLLYGAGGFYLTEKAAWEAGGAEVGVDTALWWSLVTMTTVGYGDFFPKTFAGRWLVGMPVMVIGIGVLGYALGTLATAVIERRSKEARGMVTIEEGGHVLICHCPSIETVEEVLLEIRADQEWKERGVVLLTDTLETAPEILTKAQVTFVRGNPSREAALEQANVKGAGGVIVLSPQPSDPASDNHVLAAVVTIRAIAPETYVVAECVATENTKLLRNAGASEVVQLGSLSAELLVQGLQDPGVNGLISELLTNRTGHQLYVHPINSFKGTLQDACTKLGTSRYVCLGVIDSTGKRYFAPPETLSVEPGHRLMLLGDTRPAKL